MDQHGLTASCDRDGSGPDDSQVSKVLFVCTGNICRSAFAEACLKSLLADGAHVSVSSAGIAAMVGYGMDPLMTHEAELRGIDAGGHRARQLTGRILGDSDIVLVFEPAQVEWIEREYPEHRAKVAGMGQVGAMLSAQPRRARIRPMDLMMDVKQQRPDLVESNWIADPYRRGPGAAHDAVEVICACNELIATRVAWSA